jgi:predicted PurR-regulated permease PerM
MSDGQDALKNERKKIRTAVEIAISLTLIALLAGWCLRILSPFISVTIWGAVLAVALYKPFLMLRSAVGGSQKLALVVFVLIGLGSILIPAWLFVGSLVESGTNIRQQLEEGTFTIPPPQEKVKDWPLIGNKVYEQWHEANENLRDFVIKHQESVKTIVGVVLSKAAGAGATVLQLIISLLICAAFLANTEVETAALRKLASRLAGDSGPGMVDTAVATIRSVAVGVLGTAIIQAMLAGIGLVLAGVPAAGLFVLGVLFLAVCQLPPIIALLPAIALTFSQQSSSVAVVFLIWCIFVSFSDMLLKPMLLGRGLDIPMPVILLGAIGGMVMSGIIGLFVGAVVLALGYQLLLMWIGEGSESTTDAA